MNKGLELRPHKRVAPRWQFIFGIYIALSALAIIYWNRNRLWERIRTYQTPEPERSQRRTFADQMDALQQQGEYARMRVAATAWRRSHPADPNGFATDGFAAYYLGDLNGSFKSWKQAAAMDPLVADGAAGWIGAINEVNANWQGPIPLPTLTLSDVDQAESNWKSRGDALLRAKKYDEIEATTARLQKSEASTPDGRWLLTAFFEGLVGSGDNKGTEAQWRSKVASIETWTKARPQSAVANLALSACWVNGAWVIRGTAFKSKVNNDNFGEMVRRLKSGETLLTNEIDKGSKSPLIMWTFHNYSQLAQISKPLYDSLMNREMAAFPAYTQGHFCRAIYLLPRWYGRRGDWEQYAAQAADAIGGAKGDVLYAQIVWRLQRRYRFRNMWTESRADWPRTQRGFEAILKANPKSLAAANDYLLLARAAGDNSLARRILKTYIGGRVDKECWRSTGSFARYRMSVLRDR